MFAAHYPTPGFPFEVLASLFSLASPLLLVGRRDVGLVASRLSLSWRTGCKLYATFRATSAASRSPFPLLLRKREAPPPPPKPPTSNLKSWRFGPFDGHYQSDARFVGQHAIRLRLVPILARSVGFLPVTPHVLKGPSSSPRLRPLPLPLDALQLVVPVGRTQEEPRWPQLLEEPYRRSHS